MNADERVNWVYNDIMLYNWWRSVGGGVHQFVRDNREEIDAAIVAAGGEL